MSLQLVSEDLQSFWAGPQSSLHCNLSMWLIFAHRQGRVTRPLQTVAHGVQIAVVYFSVVVPRLVATIIKLILAPLVAAHAIWLLNASRPYDSKLIMHEQILYRRSRRSIHCSLHSSLQSVGKLFIGRQEGGHFAQRDQRETEINSKGLVSEPCPKTFLEKQ
jgi:hypothetical protein